MPGLWEVVHVWTFKPNSRDMDIWAPMPTCIVMDFGLSSPSGHAVINLGLLNPFYVVMSFGPTRLLFFSKNVKTF